MPKINITINSGDKYLILGSLLYTARTETNKAIKAKYQELYEEIRGQVQGGK